ncbi:phage head closure protein [Leuconostoc garlicum]|nr:phage head closure protein [Leuconostoc garlicum]
MMNYKPSDFNKRVSFGKVETVVNEINGNTMQTFVPQLILKYAPKMRTMTQQYTILGTKFEDSILIVVRHNKNLQKNLLAKMPDSKYYDIVGISPDDSNKVITYDIVTLKLNQRGIK